MGVGGKLVQTVFFLFFFGMGSVFAFLIAREALAGLQTWTWQKTPCQFVRSEIRDTDPRGRRSSAYYFDVEYHYSVNGQQYDSTVYRLRQQSFQDYSKAERLTEAYRAGSSGFCYVNPHLPTQAVLERGSLLFPLAILFPLIFVAIGAIGIYSAWRPGSFKPGVSRPISDRAGARFGQGLATAFFGLFMLVGVIVFYFVSARPFSRILAARQWPAVPCTVVSSEVRSHRGDHGNTYSVNILYSYSFNDREYKANRYDFFGGSSSGYAGKQAIVSRYAPGSQAACYVNPSDPNEAVLVRGFTPMMWLGLLPLLFTAVGLIGLISIRRRIRAAGRTSLGGYPDLVSGNSSHALTATDGAFAQTPLLLTARSSPLGKFVGVIIATLFWNGIISVFVTHLLKSWRSGGLEWFLAVFLIPFVLIGLGLIVAVGYFFLALFNPRPRVTLTPGAPRLGDSVRLEWEVSGRVEALEDLRFVLEGREEATYTRGTRSATDRSVFASLAVSSTTSPQEMRSGTTSIEIPASLMHSFTGQHNKIIWSVQVKGKIPRWPDLSEEFALTVLPAAPKRFDNV